MPSAYKTGGKKPGKGLQDSSGKSIDITSSGAGMGTGYHQPNAKNSKGPGGYGSSGKASDSKPKGGM